MEIFRDFKEVSNLQKDFLYLVGSFDGVHLGHRYLLEEAKKITENIGIVTFTIHPKESREDFLGVLTCCSEKLELLEKYKVKRVILLNFEKIKTLDYKEFVNILYLNWNMRFLVGGEDNYLGKDKRGSLAKISEEYKEKFKVIILPPYTKNNIKVSSSTIRELLREGNIEEANEYLGYNYFIEGIKISGDGRGKQIGFPTININPLCESKLIPKDGVYKVKVKIDNKNYYGACNIGNNPTFDLKEKRIEVYLINVNNDYFYVENGETIYIEFLTYLREEIKFNNIEELKKQIKKDVEIIKQMEEKR